MKSYVALWTLVLGLLLKAGQSGEMSSSFQREIFSHLFITYNVYTIYCVDIAVFLFLHAVSLNPRIEAHLRSLQF
jgi:hypothetical protein